MKTTLSRALGAALCMLLASAGALAAPAPDAERLGAARAMLKAMQIERQLDAMSGAMGDALAKQFAHTSTSRNPRVFEIAMSESMAAMKESATRPGGLIDTIVEAYAQRFSVDELRQIRAFHESPVGQHLLQATPELMQQVMGQAMKTSRDMVPRICARVKSRLMAEKSPDGASMTCPAAP